MIRIYDQGQISSCTANAVCSAYSFDLMEQLEGAELARDFNPSRLFLYYNARVLDGSPTTKDTGCSIRLAIQSAASTGLCHEKYWPYDKENLFVQPDAKAYSAAKGNTISKYDSLPQNVDQLRACLYEGFPFVFGFEVFKSFMSPDVGKNGEMPMPTKYDECVGSHTVLAGWL